MKGLEQIINFKKTRIKLQGTNQAKKQQQLTNYVASIQYESRNGEEKDMSYKAILTMIAFMYEIRVRELRIKTQKD
ncbi:unnamed protein product (macronuclear) [Paramecium tetraurelia]|uniref:Uncharacterized protein n=1 Tax=Paramecium tetraurelia TaxID=5888 RepID=A0DWY3_PARTE|nr:uncharacterized protein GSPATT00039814001 [Paramecium tetraurelia]CAK87550.1 unnamed protein product [Paramecium tetraurelia]|eukprot:XP_001454947.1 hypothetical protein (macronuclear) [Paramecium tetraurelia strain d4-2]